MPPRRRTEQPADPDARPDEPTPPVDVRIVRADDLLVARLTAPGCHVEAGADGPVLVSESDASSLVLHLPPQHVGERAWQEGTPFGGRSAHRLAEATRLVHAVPAGTSVAFTAEALLALLPTLRLRVAGHATAVASATLDAQIDHGWAETALGPNWQRLVTTGAVTDVADLVLGADRGIALAAAAATSVGEQATRVLQGALARRLVTGLSRPAAGAVAGLSAAPDDGRDVLVGPDTWHRIPPIRLRRGPRPPTDDETSIEAPYRVTVSPSALGAFTHAPAPVTAPDDPRRAELWRTHLSVRVETEDGAFVRLDDTDDDQRIVRAIWSRDMDPVFENADDDPAPLAPQSLAPVHRRAIVRQTSDVRLPRPPKPLGVRALALSSLGAWIDWAATWEDEDFAGPLPPHTALLSEYRHQATMGRDQYVRVAEPGFLYPFGHKALWVTLTERKIVAGDAADGAVAALWQREFIVLRQPTRSYPGHRSPWGQVTVEPLVTPDLDPMGALDDPFVPMRGGTPFPFTLVATDRAGNVRTFAAPLTFVSYQSMANPPQAATIQSRAEASYAGIQQIAGRGQSISVATEATPGDTAFETNSLVFHGDIDVAHHTSTPTLTGFNAVVPSMRHLAPAAPGVDLVYAAAFRDDPGTGFGAGNPSQLVVALSGPPPAVDFSGGSDRSGGFLAPNLAVRAVSRSLGAVGDNGTTPGKGLSTGQFDPATFLDGALPKLFGLFSLLDLLEAVGLDEAPQFVTEALDTVSAIVSEADRLRSALQGVGPRLADELARAPHDGASAALEALRTQLEAAATPLLTSLEQLIDAVAALTTAPDLDAVATALAAVGPRTDALLAVLGAPRLPVAVRAALERPATALRALASAADTLKAVEDFTKNLLSPGTAVTARFEWNPTIHSWPSEADAVFAVTDPKCLRLAIEVRAGATTPPSVDVAAEITAFRLQLLPGEPLMGLAFSRIGFRASSGSKPQVDVVFDGVEFLGPLAFVDTLRRMIPFDGFADPPYVDVSPEGVTAGFDLALPNVAVGVFSLENIALGADVRVPFLGDAVSVGFHFCSKDSPFRLTVMCVGGGGWVELRAAPQGLVLLELGLEACANLAVDLGVASGSVSISVGVYLRLEGDKGLLTAYFRIRGEVDVLGLISASITLELSLTYKFETGKLVGRASLVVEVEVLFFSASVEIVVERQLAGSKGDPVLAQVLPPAPDGTNADWSAYCEAFAPLP